MGSFMHIVHVAAELTPIAKAGGLGDVVQGLCKSLHKMGQRVEIILPFYDLIDRSQLKNLKVECKILLSSESLGECDHTIWSATVEGLQLFLIESHHENNYFKRNAIYGEKDDIDRFIYFSWVSLEFLLKRKLPIDILNLHDWMTSLMAPLYHEAYKPLGLHIGGIMTSLHNLQYQGLCQPSNLDLLGAVGKTLLNNKALVDLHKKNHINLLKGGIVYSDVLTTVSPTYAKEILRDNGFGLEPLLNEHKNKLYGILNGIDTEYWDPEVDPYLEKKYPTDFAKLSKIQKGKKVNREVVSNLFHMQCTNDPLFICVTRLVHQKGPKLIRQGIEYVLENNGQFILLATTPDPNLREEFFELQDKYRENPNVYFHFGFNEKLAHLAFAAGDFIIVPSLFEPCGLTQIIGLRYGTTPIVHAIGGLVDTVFDIDHSNVPLEMKNGYTFEFPTKESLEGALSRAFLHYKTNKKRWLTLVENGLKRDSSWKKPGLSYIELYRKIT